MQATVKGGAASFPPELHSNSSKSSADLLERSSGEVARGTGEGCTCVLQ
ncbi:hypothetical protein [Mycolicibacterium hippocampi]|nr:hypothetical protein [Mycolicibacterium hippocampi]